MLNRPEVSDKELVEVNEIAYSNANSVIGIAVERAQNDKELTLNILVNEHTALHILALVLHNTVSQKRGTEQEYLDFVIEEIKRVKQSFYTDNSQLKTFAAGGEEVTDREAFFKKRLEEDPDVN